MLAYVHGDLLGYKVLYTLTKIAGSAIVVQTTKVKTVHPSLNTVIITGLEANAQYSFQVLAFNAYGDGVSSKKYYGGMDVKVNSTDFNGILPTCCRRIRHIGNANVEPFE